MVKSVCFLLIVVVFTTVQAEDTLSAVRQQGTITDTVIGLRNDHSSHSSNNLPGDNLKFNKKYHLWIPLVDVVGINAFINRFDRYVLNYDYVRVSLNSWGNNLRAGSPWGRGWIWDHDPFGNNMMFHPISGAFYYNAARSNGYNLYEALPIAFFGSYMWKIFGENTAPEREDLINTTISGVFIGEVTYRLSSDILDDRATGAERVFREIGAGLIDPVRAINRLIQGKTSGTTPKEANQKEPLDIRLSSGTYLENRGSQFGTGYASGIVDVRLDYGDPFENRPRKPYDFFKLRTELNIERERVMISMATGYGLLYGKSARPGNLDILAGAFQHWDYYDDKYFELSTIGFGPGVISKIALPGNMVFRTDLHVAGVPFGANTTRIGPYSNNTKDYDLVGGMEAKVESALDIGDWVRGTFNGCYFLTHTYVGNARDNFAKSINRLFMITPGIEVRLYRNLGAGFEHLIYYDNRDPDIPANVIGNFIRTEQKIYLTYYSGNNHHGK